MEKIFADGFLFKRPRDGAPTFVKGAISIKSDEAIAFINKHAKEGWVNLDLKESKGGKLYLELNTWEKGAKKEETATSPAQTDSVPYPSEEIKPEDIPF